MQTIYGRGRRGVGRGGLVLVRDRADQVLSIAQPQSFVLVSGTDFFPIFLRIFKKIQSAILQGEPALYVNGSAPRRQRGLNP